MTEKVQTDDGGTHLGGERVTVHVTHSVRPGKTDEFRDWCGGIRAAAQAYDPSSSATLFEPDEAGDSVYHVVFSFSSTAMLHGFWESEQGRDWRARLAQVTVTPSDYRIAPGLAHWVEQAQADHHKPSTHKMAVVAFFAIAPLVLTVPRLLAPLLEPLPTLVGQILSTGVIVVLMSYVAMPLSARLFARWLR